MSRLCYNLVLATILVIISYIAPTSCFAEWMTKDFCDRPLGLRILYLYILVSYPLQPLLDAQYPNTDLLYITFSIL